jgi:hypothetical protein
MCWSGGSIELQVRNGFFVEVPMRAVLVSGFVVCFSVLLLVSGCGGGTMTVDAITPKLALQTDTRATAQEVKVAVAPFRAARDKNKKENVIGEAKTGVFNIPGPILARETPEQIVAAAVKEALAEVGFHLVEPKEADYIIGGQVEDFWVSEYATGVSFEYAKAYVRFDLVVQNAAGNTLWGSTLEKYETSGKVWDATAENIPTLTKALAAAVSSIFAQDGFWQALSR